MIRGSTTPQPSGIRAIETDEAGERTEYAAAWRVAQATREQIDAVRNDCYRQFDDELMPGQVYMPAYEIQFNSANVEAWLNARRPDVPPA